METEKNEVRRWPSDWRERYRVRIGFVFGLLFLWRAQPRSLVLMGLGFTLAFLGVLLRQWAAGCVKKMDELATHGPYHFVRHPLYVGSFLAAAGFILAASYPSWSLRSPYLDRTLFFWCFFWVLIDSVYLPKVLKEEALLRDKFGAAYDEYASRVERFFPRAANWKGLNFGSFSWAQWRKNEEYWSLAGFCVLCVVLYFRFHYR